MVPNALLLHPPDHKGLVGTRYALSATMKKVLPAPTPQVDAPGVFEVPNAVCAPQVLPMPEAMAKAEFLEAGETCGQSHSGLD